MPLELEDLPVVAGIDLEQVHGIAAGARSLSRSPIADGIVMGQIMRHRFNPPERDSARNLT
jgi:hypothetical protein